MKNFKKIISICLALAMVCTLFSTSLIASAETENEIVIEKIDADLTKSVRVRSQNAGGTEVLSLTKFEDGVVRAAFYPGWSAVGAAGSTTWTEAIMSLNDEYDNFIPIYQGSKYIINVKYIVTNTGNKPQIGIAYNNSNNPYAYDKGSTVIASANPTAGGANTLTAEFTADVEYRYLQLVFGGSGKIAIESVEIQRVDTSADVKTVSYVNNGRTTKGFASETLDTPEFKGALQSIFGGWYTDAAFTTVATEVTDGATYYAKWLSVTREVDLGNINRLDGYNEGQTNAADTSITLGKATKDTGLKVDVAFSDNNNHSAAQLWSNLQTKNELTLEYADYDDAQKDASYDNYAKLEAGKQYAITVKYAVKSIDGTAKIAVVAANTNLGWGNGKARVLAGNNSITALGNGVIYARTNGTGLVDYSYGGTTGTTGLDLTNYKLRLSFAGNATFEITSVTIQEVYKSDIDNGKAVAVRVNDTVHNTANATMAYNAVAVKNADGSWQLPKPTKIDNAVVADFGGYYTDSALTSAVNSGTALTKEQAVYTKWNYVKTNAYLGESNGLRSSVLNITQPTETTPLLVNFQRYDQNLYDEGSFEYKTSVWLGSTSMPVEYYDNDPTATETNNNFDGYVAINKGIKYAVNVKYNVIEASYDARYYPQIAIITNASSISENVASTVHNAAKHTTVGEGLVLSAVIDGSAYASQKLRIGFGGVGKIEIESIEISEISAGETKYPTVTLVDGDNKSVEFFKNGATLPVLEHKEDANFGAWLNAEGEKVEIVSGDVTLTAKYFELYDVNFDDETNLKDLVNIKKAAANIYENNGKYDTNRDGKLAGAEDLSLFRTFLLFM